MATIYDQGTKWAKKSTAKYLTLLKESLELRNESDHMKIK